jgi:hypothetical protein
MIRPIVLLPADVEERALRAGCRLSGEVLGPVENVAVGNRELDVAGGLEQLVGGVRVVGDGELFGLLVGLVLVQEDDPVDLQPVQVGQMQIDLALPAVAGEGSLDAVPERVQVQYRFAVGGLAGMPPDQVGFLDPDRAGADGFDFD